MKKKKLTAILLAVMMVFCYIPSMAFATDGAAPATSTAQAVAFADMPDDWSTAALKAAVANGLIKGYDGADGQKYIMPSGTLTRAELATIVNRAFGSFNKASLAGATDVSATEWYADEISKAVYMGTMKLDTMMRPNDKVTRQEAFTILARAFKLEGTGNTASLNSFNDGNKVADWAKGSVAALVEAGYVSGSGGMLNPTANITRAEFAKIMDNMVKQYVKEAKEVTGTIEGNVMVNVPGVKFDNATITGMLVVGDGVGTGNLYLHNTKVKGDMVVRGGGVNSIIITGDTTVGKVIISKVDGNVRVAVDDASKVNVVIVNDGKDDVIIKGSIDTLHVDAADVNVIVQNAELKNIEIESEKSIVKLTEESKVDTVLIHESAAESKVVVDKKSAVDTMTSKADGVTVEGAGTVNTATVEGNNTAVNTKGTEVTAAEGTTGVTADGKDVATGEVVQEKQPNPATSGHGHYYAYKDNGDGTHTGTCSCNSVKTEDHNFDSNRKCTVCNAAQGNAVASVQTADGFVYYDSLTGEEGAIAALESGNTLRVLANVSATGSMDIVKENVTVDLNNKTLTFDENTRLRVKNDAIIIKNGTISGGDRGITIFGSNDPAKPVNVTIDDVTIENTNYGIIYTGYDQGNKLTGNVGYGEVTLNNVRINNNTADSVGIFVMGNLGNAANTGLGDANNVITINNSNIIGSGVGVALNGYATLNVNENTEISGADGVVVKRGKLNVVSGTIKGTGQYTTPVHAVNSGTESIGAAVLVTSTYNQYGKITLDLSGGKYESTNSHAVAVIVPDGANAFNNIELKISGGNYTSAADKECIYVGPNDSVSKFITGGTFSSDPSAYIAVGYGATNKKDASRYEVVTLDELFAGGDGTEQNPYLISTIKQFGDFAASVNVGNSYEGLVVALKNDLNMRDVADWTMIGTIDNPFKGTFDGQYHTIKTPTAEGITALFGHVGGDAVFKDITLSQRGRLVKLMYHQAHIRSLTFNNVDYESEDKEYYNVGHNGSLYFSYNYDYATKTWGYVFNLINCDVNMNLRGGDSSNAAVFIGAYCYERPNSHITVKDCSYDGTFRGNYVALLLSNGQHYGAENGPESFYTVENLVNKGTLFGINGAYAMGGQLHSGECNMNEYCEFYDYVQTTTGGTYTISDSSFTARIDEGKISFNPISGSAITYKVNMYSGRKIYDSAGRNYASNYNYGIIFDVDDTTGKTNIEKHGFVDYETAISTNLIDAEDCSGDWINVENEFGGNGKYQLVTKGENTYYIFKFDGDESGDTYSMKLANPTVEVYAYDNEGNLIGIATIAAN